MANAGTARRPDPGRAGQPNPGRSAVVRAGQPLSGPMNAASSLQMRVFPASPPSVCVTLWIDGAGDEDGLADGVLSPENSEPTISSRVPGVSDVLSCVCVSLGSCGLRVLTAGRSDDPA